MADERCKVVILVGGPTTGTRFRPLTFDVPKPLVPLGGVPLVGLHINACAQLKQHGLLEVILIGYFEEDVFQDFCKDSSKQLGVPVNYLKEPTHVGTAGGLALFHDEICDGFTETNEKNTLFVLHGDVACPFPLVEMLQTYRQKKGAGGCLLGRNVREEDVHHYGCLVFDKETQEILHYVEKPEGEQVLSNTVNCGVYLFSLSHLYTHLKNIHESLTSDVLINPSPLRSGGPGAPLRIRMEYELLPLMVDEHQLYVHHLSDWWIPIKHPAAALETANYLMKTQGGADLPFSVPYLSSKDQKNIIGNVYIHPSAKVDPTAVVGPNVSVYEDCVIGAGVRVSNSIIFKGTVLKPRSCVLYSIVCMDSTIGEWSRIEGQPKSAEGITVVGKGVEIRPEIIIRSTIVLPHKSVSENTENKIIL